MRLIGFLIVLLTCASCQCQAKYILSVCAIFQNEAAYLKEWVDYHESIGVQHFWLYNNNSCDNYEEVLDPYIKRHLVTLIEWPSVQQENDWKNFSFTTQTSAYNDCIKNSQTKTKWLALIDVDEYLICIIQNDFASYISKEYHNYAGITINWQCYGHSNKTLLPGESMLKNLTMKMKWDHEWNKHSKSIVQPKYVKSCPNPHYCTYIFGKYAVNPNKEKTDACNSYVTIDKLRINHYWTKDLWFFENVKIERYKKWGVDIQGSLDHAKIMNEEYDPILMR